MALSTPKQRQDLGYLRKLLNLDDDLYHEILEGEFGVVSSKELSRYEINKLINKFRDKAKAAGVFKPKASFIKHSYNNLDGREAMASPAQLRKITAMWLEVSKMKTKQAKLEALTSFTKRITGKDSLNFLTAIDVRKVIKAIENIKS